MGGYGAVKAALTCPDKYFACASLSGSLDITRKGRAIDLPLWQSIFDFHMKDPTELEGVHSWDYWDKYIQDALRFLLQ